MSDRIWLDEAEVDPSWARPALAPTSADPHEDVAPVRRRTVRPSLVYGSLLLALLLLIGGSWALGGFKGRQDRLRVVAPGELINSEPYEFRFTSATAQRKVDSLDKKVTWQVVVIGQGRTTGKVSISPTYYGDSGMFVAKDLATGQIQSAGGQRVGDDASFSRSAFTPGLPMLPYQLTFAFTDAYRPGPTILFALLDQEYGPHYLLDDEQTWHNSAYGEQLRLPVTVLAESA